jgi:hypothetical protein
MSTQYDATADLLPTYDDNIRERIKHVLTIFPTLSHSMLQVGIGTGVPPALWHPVLNQMVKDGTLKKKIVQTTNPVTGRSQTYTLIEAA